MTVTSAPCTAEPEPGGVQARAELTAGPAAEPAVCAAGDDYALAFNGVRALLRLAGRDPGDPDVERTPQRVIKALVEMTTPPGPPPEALLGVTFAGAHSFATQEMIALGPVPFTSLCEHHLLPFTGHAWIAYLPAGDQIVGLSKLARLVDWHAHALQVQERLTKAVTDDLTKHLDLRGAACMVEANHTCMSARGVLKPGALMRTTSLTGAFRANVRVGTEFIAFCEANRP